MKNLSLFLTIICLCMNAADMIPFITQAPSMRGVPGDPAWRDALKTMDFRQNRPTSSNGKVTVWLGRTVETLYIAMLSEHANIEAFRRDQTDHDGEIYSDDDFEFFLDFRGQKKDYLQFLCNTNGALLDLYMDVHRRLHLDYESGAIARGSIQKNSYYVEAAIPLASLRLGENETGLIGICFGRTISWNKDSQSCFGKYHQPNTWKYFQLPFQTPLILKKASYDLTEGKQPFCFEVCNTSARNLELVFDLSGNKRTVSFSPGATQSVTLDAVLKTGTEPVRKSLKISDGSGRILLQWSVYGKVKPLFEASLYSAVLYRGEDARLKITLNNRSSGNVMLQAISQDGKVLVRKTLPVQTETMNVDLAVPAETLYIFCQYGSNQMKFPVRIIQSPWEK